MSLTLWISCESLRMFTVSRESSGSRARTVFSLMLSAPVTMTALTRTFMFFTSMGFAFFSASMRTSRSERSISRAALLRSLSIDAADVCPTVSSVPPARSAAARSLASRFFMRSIILSEARRTAPCPHSCKCIVLHSASPHSQRSATHISSHVKYSLINLSTV